MSSKSTIAARTVRVCLYLDLSRMFRWQLWLAEAVAAIPGYEVFVVFSQERRPLPKSCLFVFELERIIYGIKGTNAIDPVSDSLIRRATNGAAKEPFDVLVDFAADQSRLANCERVLTPCFNNSIPGEIGAIAGLINDPSLLIEVHDSARPANPWTAHPAVADRDVLLQCIDNGLSCAVRLVLKAIAAPVQSSIPWPSKRSPVMASFVGIRSMAQEIAAISRKMGRYLKILAIGGKHWSVAWRINPSATLFDAEAATFALLADDGNRFYADPFPFRQGGQDFVFVEEFPFSTQRGCISVAKIENGYMHTPLPVLEESYHLSYPFIFEHGGEIWAIPESGEGRGIYLYRAEQFPFKWKQEGCLLSDINGYDSTLLRHNGRFWLFVCERVWNSSSSDILSVFYSDNLTGQWLPHSDNPVLFDATLSRPAGAIFQRDGNIIRPIQDCSQQYGGAVVLCRIDALGSQEFAQTVTGRIHCEQRGCHTYNNYSGLEVIDVFGRQRGLKEVAAIFSSC
jgi:hypothetical protein